MNKTKTPKDKWSYSRASTFAQCPRRYKLRYIDKLETLPDQDPQNALYLGTAIHKGLEKDVEAAVESYKSNYYCLGTENYNEIIKLEALIPKAKAKLPDGQHEVKIENKAYIGYIDLLADDWILDFKYSNNRDGYLESPQIHLYKFFADRPIGRLSYVFIPKINIRQGKNETITEFRNRLNENLEAAEVDIVDVDYDERKVEAWLDWVHAAQHEKEFPRNETRLCEWCNYKNYCLKGENWMIYEKGELK